jgi:hypothetical protein
VLRTAEAEGALWMPAERRSRVIQVRGYDDDDESSEDDRSDVFSDPNHNKGRYYQGCSDSEESDTESSSDNEDKGPKRGVYRHPFYVRIFYLT